MSKFSFRASSIPNNLQLGRIILGWLMQFGGTPFYKENIFSLLLPESSIAQNFVFCFVETFNSASKRKQMNVADVIFLDNTKQDVVPYTRSHFMGHAITD